MTFDEPPISFFQRGNDPELKTFTNVFDFFNTKGRFNTGDGIYNVFGHGGVDSKGGYVVDLKLGGPPPDSAISFDNRLKSVSSSYKKNVESQNKFIMTLYICQSGTGINSLAQQISKAHPNATVYGFDGFVIYGSRGGIPSIVGISTNPKTNLNNNGYQVEFRNGIETNRTKF